MIKLGEYTFKAVEDSKREPIVPIKKIQLTNRSPTTSNGNWGCGITLPITRPAKTRLPTNRRKEMIAKARVDVRPFSNKLPPNHPGVAKPSRQKKVDTPMMPSRTDSTVRSLSAIIFRIHGTRKEHPVVFSVWADRSDRIMFRVSWPDHNEIREGRNDTIFEMCGIIIDAKRQLTRVPSAMKSQKKRD